MDPLNGKSLLLAKAAYYVILAGMSKRDKVIGLGQVLWDVFPQVPRFGGAPANFACHAAALGADVAMVSRVGEDELGEQAIAFLQQRNVDTSAIGRSADLPTGTVQVTLDENNSPSYEIAAPVAAWQPAAA